MPPIYSYACDCGVIKEEWRKVDDRFDAPKHCNRRMQIQICAPSIQADIKPYKSMIDGSMITSRSQHRNHLRQHNKIEVGNEVDALMKMNRKKPLDREKRKRTIAELLNR